MWENRKMASEAQIRAIDKYQKKTYDRIIVKVRKEAGEKEKFQAYADSLDLSLQSFITKAVKYIIENNIKLK